MTSSRFFLACETASFLSWFFFRRESREPIARFTAANWVKVSDVLRYHGMHSGFGRTKARY